MSIKYDNFGNYVIGIYVPSETKDEGGLNAESKFYIDTDLDLTKLLPMVSLRVGLLF